MKTVISCVADRQPKYLRQAMLLIASLRASGVAADDPSTEIVIHVPADLIADERFEILTDMGARLAPFKRFAPDRPGAFCNKLRQFETPALQKADRVLLLDVDILFRRDPRLYFEGDAVRAKIVDKSAPPLDVVRPLFAHLGVALPEFAAPDLAPGQRTPRFNCNGGVYYLPAAAFAALGKLWPEVARRCLESDCQAILGEHGKHADQLAFALAMSQLDLPFSPLSIAANFPTNFAPHRYEVIAPCEIAAFHYHHKCDEDGLPVPTEVDWIDTQIAEAKARLDD